MMVAIAVMIGSFRDTVIAKSVRVKPNAPPETTPTDLLTRHDGESESS